MISRVGAGRRAKRLLAAAFCAFAVLAFAPDGSTAGPADASIVVHGNRRVDPAAIRGHFHAAPDGRLDPGAVNEGLKTLYATGLFEDVKIGWSGPRLIVTVVEAPVIDRVQFEGNKQLKDKDLASEIPQFRLCSQVDGVAGAGNREVEGDLALRRGRHESPS